MGKRVVKGLLMMLCCGMLVSCGSAEGNEVKEEVKKPEVKDEYKGFIDYEDEDFTIKMPEVLKETKAEKDIITYSGIILELEEKKTWSELEKEKLNKDAKKDSEEVKKDVKPLILEFEKEIINTGLKEYHEALRISKNVKLKERIYSILEKDYYIISWKENNLVYYEKGILKDKELIKFRYSFAEDKKENYNEIVGKTCNSFKLK